MKHDNLGNKDLELCINKYNETVGKLYDHLCPKIIRKIKYDKSKRWYNKNLYEMRKKKRRAERAYLKSKSLHDLNKYREIKNQYNYTLKKTRIDFYSDKLEKLKHDPKNLHRTLREITGNQQQRTYPSYSSDKEVGEDFSSFYVDKITDIRTKIISETSEIKKFTSVNLKKTREVINKYPSLDHFNEINSDELCEIVNNLKKKHCFLDPCPTSLLVNLKESLDPIFLNIINTSIRFCIFPGPLKHAIITPVIKSSSLDRESLKNYRPVSSLSFLSKILEKTLYLQLNKHIEENQLYPYYQSSYRQYHSCETTLLKMTDEIQQAIFEKKTTCLIMLDSSSAFDTVDQSLLLTKLQDNFYVKNGALRMIKSYLTNRTFSVKINETISSPRELIHGVPQGSLLGPLFYVLYTKEIEKIVLDYGLSLQCYADDCQIYISFTQDAVVETENKLLSCLSEVTNWMRLNFLKLNSEKTKIKLFKHKLSFTPDLSKIGVICNESVKVLGVNFDENLRFGDFIANKIRICNFQLRNLYNIKDSLNTSTRIMLVTSLILSTIDYCNILMLGITDKDLRPLKLMINKSVRFIYDLKPTSHITPYYKKAHFLPIKLRIKFKACLTAFNIFNNKSPNYLIADFNKFVPTSNVVLREGFGRDKCMFSLNSGNVCQRRLSTLIKREWNSLPLTIRRCTLVESFKTQLKTHLFLKY